MTVAIDTSVFLAAAFWRGTARKCWALCAAHRHPIAVTEDILAEYRRKAQALAKHFPQVNPNPFLRWIENECPRLAPNPLGKQRSRDPSDDMFLAFALASRARFPITRDRDLLALGKPFGIAVITDEAFLEFG
ncbi:MAG TPA: putative toxin-antitoxin system toxin component, PIN family [Candidatus Acidoferrum sp.]|jgi:putative PIN family toxin of toxin-antitoxin system|nr:putative toxin-antitoxin system toxin component, PIN family [Candidatus Acidoferrum sp.]